MTRAQLRVERSALAEGRPLPLLLMSTNPRARRHSEEWDDYRIRLANMKHADRQQRRGVYIFVSTNPLHVKGQGMTAIRGDKHPKFHKTPLIQRRMA